MNRHVPSMRGMLRASSLHGHLAHAPHKLKTIQSFITRLQVSLASPDGLTLPHMVRPSKVIRSGPIPLAILIADQWTPHTGIVLERLESGTLVVDVGCEVNGVLPAAGYFANDVEELTKLSPGDRVTCYACCKYPEARSSQILYHMVSYHVDSTSLVFVVVDLNGPRRERCTYVSPWQMANVKQDSGMRSVCGSTSLCLKVSGMDGLDADAARCQYRV